MKRIIAIMTIALAASADTGSAQTTPTAPRTSPAPESLPASEGLKDLDAMTFSCPRAALNAAAREAAKFQAEGTYQFSYFKIVTGSHHALYEVHFTSNYAGEQDLKYCVALYCQQGWEPAKGIASVTRMTGTPAAHMGSCADSPNRRSSAPRPSAPRQGQ